MSEAERIVLTAAVTILGGLIVVVGGQLASRFFIEPWYEQRKVIGSIAEALLAYYYLFAESGTALPEVPEASLRLRQLSSELMARTVAIPRYHSLAALGWAPTMPAIREASRGLWRLANTLGDPQEWRMRVLDASRVAVALGIEDIDPGMLGKEFADTLREG